jgi:hypothetical protein
MLERDVGSFMWMDAIANKDVTKRAPRQKGALGAKTTMEAKRKEEFLRSRMTCSGSKHRRQEPGQNKTGEE